MSDAARSSGSGPDAAVYPAGAAARDRFVIARRGTRPVHDPWRHQGVIVEDERTADGSPSRMATVFLTGRECPWRCAMCDLWRYTTTSDTPPGAIAAQLAAARSELRARGEAVDGMKLYNAGSFFDARAVPEADYEPAAASLAGLSRVVVESHPALVGTRVDRFLEAIGSRHGPADPPPRLEVAIGLETAHPGALDRLNKRFTVDDFARAAAALRKRGVALRVFLLISPPFVPAARQDDWLLKSLDTAFDCGASVVSLVPTRGGNGTLETLAANDLFEPPRLEDVERGFALALERGRNRGRVFVDLWDFERLASCPSCASARRDRLHRMNLEQRILPAHTCSSRSHAVAR